MPEAAYQLPLPLAAFRASPTLSVSGATVHGAVICIVVAWWQAGCGALPSDDAGLQALARTYGSQWMRVRENVKQALSEILPSLAEAYAKAAKGRAGRVAVSRLGGMAKARKMAQARMTATAPHTPSEPAVGLTRFQPVRASAYRGDGRTDMQARQASIERQRAAGPRPGLLTDSIHRPG